MNYRANTTWYGSEDLDKTSMFGKGALLISIFVLLRPISFDIVGSLPLSEVFALACLPFLGVPSLLRRYPQLRQALVAYALILLGIMVADFVNSSAPSDYLRGWANMVMGASVLIFFLAIFDRNPKAILWFFMMSALLAIFTADTVFDIDKYMENANYIKGDPIRYLIPLSMLTAFFLERRSPNAGVFFLVLVGFFLMLINARSAGLGILFAGVLLYFRFGFSLQLKNIFYMLFFSVLLYGLYLIYLWFIFEYQMAGSTLIQLQRVGNVYNPIELIRAGRTGLWVAMSAIWDNPVAGWGSWGRDPNLRYWTLYSELSELSYVVSDRGFIPSHSVLLTAWLWGGLLGLVGVARLGWLILVSLRFVPWFPAGYRLLAYVLFATMMWHFLFSPFGHIRSSIPIALAFIWAMTHVITAPKDLGRRKYLETNHSYPPNWA